jgi:hypothetical protein
MPYRKGHQSAWQYSRPWKTGEGSSAHEVLVVTVQQSPAVRPRVPAGPGQRRCVRGNEAVDEANIYPGRSLKGEKPAEAPVMRPTRFRLVINL